MLYSYRALVIAYSFKGDAFHYHQQAVETIGRKGVLERLERFPPL
jgi:hypothetical protein